MQTPPNFGSYLVTSITIFLVLLVSAPFISAVVPEFVYVGGVSGSLEQHRTSNGGLAYEWDGLLTRSTLPQTAFHIDFDRLVVYTDDGAEQLVVASNISDDYSVLWNHDTGGEIYAIDTNSLGSVAVAHSNTLTRLNPSTGSQICDFTTTLRFNDVAIDDSDNLYGVSSNDNVYKLDSSCNEVWNYSSFSDDVYSVDFYDDLVVAGGASGDVHLIDGITGAQECTYTGLPTNAYAKFSFDGSQIFVVGGSSSVVLNPVNCQVLNSYSFGTGSLLGIVGNDSTGFVLHSAADSYIRSTDFSSTLWTWNYDGSPSAFNNRFIVLSDVDIESVTEAGAPSINVPVPNLVLEPGDSFSFNPFTYFRATITDDSVINSSLSFPEYQNVGNDIVVDINNDFYNNSLFSVEFINASELPGINFTGSGGGLFNISVHSGSSGSYQQLWDLETCVSNSTVAVNDGCVSDDFTATLGNFSTPPSVINNPTDVDLEVGESLTRSFNDYFVNHQDIEVCFTDPDTISQVCATSSSDATYGSSFEVSISGYSYTLTALSSPVSDVEISLVAYNNDGSASTNHLLSVDPGNLFFFYLTSMFNVFPDAEDIDSKTAIGVVVIVMLITLILGYFISSGIMGSVATSGLLISELVFFTLIGYVPIWMFVVIALISVFIGIGLLRKSTVGGE